MKLFKEGQLAIREILSRLTTTPVADRTLRRDLSYLKELGLVEETGQGRSLVWGLTVKGEAALKESGHGLRYIPSQTSR